MVIRYRKLINDYGAREAALRFSIEFQRLDITDHLFELQIHTYTTCESCLHCKIWRNRVDLAKETLASMKEERKMVSKLLLQFKDKMEYILLELNRCRGDVAARPLCVPLCVTQTANTLFYIIYYLIGI